MLAVKVARCSAVHLNPTHFVGLLCLQLLEYLLGLLFCRQRTHFARMFRRPMLIDNLCIYSGYGVLQCGATR